MIRGRSALLLCLGILVAGVAGCGDTGVGQRYRAERALWKAQREAQRLAIQPGLARPVQWRNLAAEFEAIAAGHASVGAGEKATSAGQIRKISARALINAAQIYSGLGDTLRMTAVYDKVRREYDDIPAATSEVALAQGQIAETRRDWLAAASAYDAVIPRIKPKPGDSGVAGRVLELPLRVARLRTAAASSTSPAAREALYAQARRYYQDQIKENPGTAAAVESAIHLAEAENDLGNWEQAVDRLSEAEKALVNLEKPPKDPAEVRYAIGAIQTARGEARSSRNTFESLVADYPRSKNAPRALIAASSAAEQAGDIDAAIAYLDRVREEYPQVEELAAQAMLATARLLEGSDRWGEALPLLRALPIDHPLSEPALLAPLEIVAHYTRMGDTTAVAREVARAEDWYRQFLERYPQGSATLSARRKLVEALALQSRYGEAVQELTGLGKSMGPSPEGAKILLEAARMSIVQLADTARTAEILEYTGQLFSDAEVGRWAASEAKRLREVIR